MSVVRSRLEALGITLPSAPKPVAAYVPAVRAGNLVMTAGQIPMLDGELTCQGAVPEAVSVERAQQAARTCALNGIAVVADQLEGDLDRIRRIVRLGVFVCSEPGFTDQPLVANGASDVLLEIFDEAGRHARSAVGVIALPLGASVEVEMVVEVD